MDDHSYLLMGLVLFFTLALALFVSTYIIVNHSARVKDTRRIDELEPILKERDQVSHEHPF